MTWSGRTFTCSAVVTTLHEKPRCSTWSPVHGILPCSCLICFFSKGQCSPTTDMTLCMCLLQPFFALLSAGPASGCHQALPSHGHVRSRLFQQACVAAPAPLLSHGRRSLRCALCEVIFSFHLGFTALYRIAAPGSPRGWHPLLKACTFHLFSHMPCTWPCRHLAPKLCNILHTGYDISRKGPQSSWQLHHSVDTQF